MFFRFLNIDLNGIQLKIDHGVYQSPDEFFYDIQLVSDLLRLGILPVAVSAAEDTASGPAAPTALDLPVANKEDGVPLAAISSTTGQSGNGTTGGILIDSTLSEVPPATVLANAAAAISPPGSVETSLCPPHAAAAGSASSPNCSSVEERPATGSVSTAAAAVFDSPPTTASADDDVGSPSLDEPDVGSGGGAESERHCERIAHELMSDVAAAMSWSNLVLLWPGPFHYSPPPSMLAHQARASGCGTMRPMISEEHWLCGAERERLQRKYHPLKRLKKRSSGNV